jgi:hypothetical protein
MNARQTLILLLVIIVGATVANLIALKIASDQVKANINTNSTYGALLGLLGGNRTSP